MDEAWTGVCRNALCEEADEIRRGADGVEGRPPDRGEARRRVLHVLGRRRDRVRRVGRSGAVETGGARGGARSHAELRAWRGWGGGSLECGSRGGCEIAAAACGAKARTVRLVAV